MTISQCGVWGNRSTCVCWWLVVKNKKIKIKDQSVKTKQTTDETTRWWDETRPGQTRPDQTRNHETSQDGHNRNLETRPSQDKTGNHKTINLKTIKPKDNQSIHPKDNPKERRITHADVYLFCVSSPVFFLCFVSVFQTIGLFFVCNVFHPLYFGFTKGQCGIEKGMRGKGVGVRGSDLGVRGLRFRGKGKGVRV